MSMDQDSQYQNQNTSIKEEYQKDQENEAQFSQSEERGQSCVNINSRVGLYNCFNFQVPRFQINFSIRPGQQIVNQSFRHSQYEQSESQRNYEYEYSEDFSQSVNEFQDQQQQQQYFIYESRSSVNSNQFFFQESQSVMQIIERQGLSEEQIQAFPEMIWTSTHRRFDKGQQCSFCLQEYEIQDTLKVISCMHRFHKDCLIKWLKTKNSCPLCKHILQPN